MTFQSTGEYGKIHKENTEDTEKTRLEKQINKPRKARKETKMLVDNFVLKRVLSFGLTGDKPPNARNTRKKIEF